ncbi:MAG: hypothetical protein ACOYMN_16935, partial [Roseimicrobium sp.]
SPTGGLHQMRARVAEALRSAAFAGSCAAMKRYLTLCATLLLAPQAQLPAEATPAPHTPAPRNYILGTQAIGGRYQFTEDEPLLESARRIAELGSGIMKFSISPQATYGPAKANVRQRNPHWQTLAEVASKEPTHRAVLDMPFRDFFLWAYPFTTHGAAGQFPPAERALEYREMYDLACHLLRTYSGTGKSFYLGHWEGDWHLRPHFDPKQPIPPDYAANFIAWLKVRQQALDAAKRDTPHERVWLWHYTEVNLVQPFLAGGSCLTNDILPQVDIDYVSYSAYDSLQGEIRKDLPAALNYIEAQLRPKPSIPGKRVFIGEYGFPARRYSPEEQNRKSIETMIAGIEWGCPFVLYWELYDNEGTAAQPGGFWLINDRNEKQPVWHTHRRFYEWARQHTQKAAPSLDDFRRSAAAFLREL